MKSVRIMKNNATAGSLVRYQKNKLRPAPHKDKTSIFLKPPTPYFIERRNIINIARVSPAVSKSDQVPPLANYEKKAMKVRIDQINQVIL